MNKKKMVWIDGAVRTMLEIGNGHSSAWICYVRTNRENPDEDGSYGFFAEDTDFITATTNGPVVIQKAGILNSGHNLWRVIADD